MGRRITVRSTGDFRNTHKFLQKISKGGKHYENILNEYGRKGVEALKAATPVDSGLTRDSWSYQVRTSEKYGYYAIHWTNSNVVDDWANIAILIQYGHATRNGGYVQGRDYINPAILPIFEEMAEKLWKEVTDA